MSPLLTVQKILLIWKKQVPKLSLEALIYFSCVVSHTTYSLHEITLPVVFCFSCLVLGCTAPRAAKSKKLMWVSLTRATHLPSSLTLGLWRDVKETKFSQCGQNLKALCAPWKGGKGGLECDCGCRCALWPCGTSRLHLTQRILSGSLQLPLIDWTKAHTR